MSKKHNEPTSATMTADVKPKQYKVVPTQRTFGFPFFTPTFIIDWYVNRWLKNLVENKGCVPMKGDSIGGTFMIHQSYLFTTKIEIQDDKPTV